MTIPMNETARKELKTRMNRISGQVAGIQRMVDEDRYCVDILNQIAAVRSALDRVGIELLSNHVEGCVLGHGTASEHECAQPMRPSGAGRRAGAKSWAIFSSDPEKGNTMETQRLDVQGMMCDACVHHVTNALQGLDGVQSAQVNLQDKQATVTFDPAKVTMQQMADAVAEEGYTATPLR